MLMKSFIFFRNMDVLKLFFAFFSVGVFEVSCSRFSTVNGFTFIENIDISCNETGISTKVTFKHGFGGTVYAAGNALNDACRSTAKDIINGTLSLLLPTEECGTSIGELDNNIYLSNTIVVQRHSILETNFDVIRSVICTISSDSLLQVKEQERHEVRYEDEGMQSHAWIEFLSDKNGFPAAKVSKVRVGDEFMLAVRATGVRQQKDFAVQDCIAHDEETVEGSRSLIHFYNSNNCRPTHWKSKFTQEIGLNVSSKVIFMKIKAFRFPGKMTVHFTCSIQVCKNPCPTYCKIPEDDRHGFLQSSRVKRSEKAFPNKSFRERHRLMKATIQALGKRLLSRRGQRYETDIEFLRRISGMSDPQFSNTMLTSITTKNPNEENYVSTRGVTITQEIDNSTIGFAEQSSTAVSMLKPRPIDTMWNELYYIKLTSKIIILSSKNQHEYLGTTRFTRLEQGCSSKQTFQIIIGVLGFALFCLCFICIGLILHMRKHNKKHRLESFLLYNLR